MSTRLTGVNFRSIYDQGFVRIAACSNRTSIAIPPDNAATIIGIARTLDAEGAALAVFPELCLTGYAIDDLLLNDVVLNATLAAIETLRAATADLLPAIVVGAPLRNGNRLYNCAVVLHRGRVLGVVPKSYLPNYREFYEKRHFAEAPRWSDDKPLIALAGVKDADAVPFGAGIVFRAVDLPDFCFSVEICEDMWVPLPPSTLAAMRGATVLVNISGSPITVGRADDRELLCRSASARDLAAYV